jgi:hypothetical protein
MFATSTYNSLEFIGLHLESYAPAEQALLSTLSRRVALHEEPWLIAITIQSTARKAFMCAQLPIGEICKAAFKFIRYDKASNGFL